jgi:hypothetical protein
MKGEKDFLFYKMKYIMSSECFSLVRNGLERNSEHFYPPRNGSERNCEVSSVILFYEMVRNEIPSFFIFRRMAQNGIQSFFRSTKQTELLWNESKFPSPPCSAMQILTSCPMEAVFYVNWLSDGTKHCSHIVSLCNTQNSRSKVSKNIGDFYLGFGE